MFLKSPLGDGATLSINIWATPLEAMLGQWGKQIFITTCTWYNVLCPLSSWFPQEFCHSNKAQTNTADPPVLHVALQGGRERRQRTRCCSAARPHSPTPDYSCSATSGLAVVPWCWVRRGDKFPFRQQTQAAPEPYPTVILSGDTRKLTLAALDVWTQLLPMPALQPSGRGEQKYPGYAVPKETQSRSAQLGALSTQIPTPTSPSTMFPEVTGC